MIQNLEEREDFPMIVQDEMKGGVKLPELVEALGLAVVNKGEDYEEALVGIKDVNRPGLQLVGLSLIHI